MARRRDACGRREFYTGKTACAGSGLAADQGLELVHQFVFTLIMETPTGWPSILEMDTLCTEHRFRPPFHFVVFRSICLPSSIPFLVACDFVSSISSCFVVYNYL